MVLHSSTVLGSTFLGSAVIYNQVKTNPKKDVMHVRSLPLSSHADEAVSGENGTEPHCGRARLSQCYGEQELCVSFDRQSSVLLL